MTTNKIGNFVIIGIKGMTVRNKADMSVVAVIDKLTEISLSDSLSIDYLRGGLNNPKILSIYGDRETTFTASNATLSTELLAIMTGSETQQLTSQRLAQPVYKDEIKSNKVTLPKTPSVGARLDVLKLDQYGKRTITMEKVASAPQTGQYSISGGVLTFNASESGYVEVFYYADSNIESIQVTDIKPKNFFFEGHIYLQEIESGQTYDAVLEIPNGAIKSEYTLEGNNSATPPTAIPITIDLLVDNLKGYPFKIDINKQSV